MQVPSQVPGLRIAIAIAGAGAGTGLSAVVVVVAAAHGLCLVAPVIFSH